MLKFTEDHEWLNVEDGVATVGITDYAATQLGDLVFIELPEVGAELAKGAAAAVVESVKAASEVFAPLGGLVIAVNQDVVDDPAIVNADPLGKGWLYRLKLADAAALDRFMDEPAYRALTA